MNVLVTGSSGHVGGAIVRHLMERGHSIVGVSRGFASDLPSEVQQIAADIASGTFPESILKSVKPCHAIVHAAAEIDMRSDARALSLTNGLGTQQTLTLAKAWRVSSFVYLSSVPVIGTPKVLPITEDHTVAPRTAYHASKLYGEYLATVAQLEGLTVATLRLTAPVGPGMPKNRILSIFVQRAKEGLPLELNGKGTRRQNYVDVRDVALAVEGCLEKNVSGLYNVGGGESVSNRELAERCIAALHSTSSIAYTDMPDPDDELVWDVSIEAARKAFGYMPTCTLEDSIRAVA